jgi:hypothetical protein
MDDPKYLWIAGIVGSFAIVLLIVLLDRIFDFGLDIVGRVTGKKRRADSPPEV